jgi:ribosome biogenesis GTPase A
VLDARFIQETRNLELEEPVKGNGKLLINVINKIDLIPHEKLIENPFLISLKPYVLISSSKRIGIGKLRERIKIEVKRLKVKFSKAHVGVIGYPNIGKSTTHEKKNENQYYTFFS